MIEERMEIFREIAKAFDSFPTAIDLQSDTMDILQITQSVTSEKQVFLGIANDPERAAPYKACIKVASERGALVGSGRIVVHRSYRALAIAEPRIAARIEERSRKAATVYWSTLRPDLHRLFQSGDTTSFTDTELLEYPECCVAWHYDCFYARGMEAFADFYSCQNAVGDALQLLSDGWHPTPGWFLPRQHYLCAILVSNRAYPFIEHIACPACLGSPNSASALANRSNSEAVLYCDPERHKGVSRYSAGLDRQIRQLVNDRNRSTAAELEGGAWSVRGVDTYKRHSRHLFAALGLDKHR